MVIGGYWWLLVVRHALRSEWPFIIIHLLLFIGGHWWSLVVIGDARVCIA